MPDRHDLELLMRSLKSVVGDGPWTTATNRLSAMVAAHAGTADAAAAFDVYFAQWRTMPDSDPRRPTFAGYLLQLVPLMRRSGSCCTYEQAVELAASALTVQDPEWQATIIGVRSLAMLEDPVTQRDPELLKKIMEDLDTVAGRLPEGSTAGGFGVARAVVLVEYARLRGGEAELEAAIDELVTARRGMAHRPDEQAYLTCHIACLRAGRAYLAMDADAMARHVRAEELALARLPRRHPGRASAEGWLAVDRIKLRGLITERRGKTSPEPRPGRDAHKPAHRSDHHELVLAAIEILETAEAGENPETVGRAAGLLREAMAQCDEGDELWVRCAAQLAMALLLQSSLVAWEPKPLSHLSRAGRQITAQTNEAISLLRQAFRATEGPAHPLWLSIGHALADALRSRSMMLPLFRTGTAMQMWKESREVALDALSGLAWSALLQSGPRHGMEAGSRAMEDHCLDIALWCIEDNELDDAVRALDSGRALVLHSAQVHATVPDMLRQLGQHELAEEWRAAGPVPPDPDPGAPGRPATVALPAATGPGMRLRRQALEVLTASPYREKLLSPPSAAEIAWALRTLDTDALVYLVPAKKLSLPRLGGKAPGAALIVSADGMMWSIELPNLRLDAPELAAYQAVGGVGRGPRRDAGPADLPQTGWLPQAAEALDQLCSWAWRSVLAPLAGQFDERGGFFGAQSGASRLPSVVLVPIGALGAVPWHASWRSAGQGRRYALQDLHVSYAPSARTLCEVAGRTPADVRAPGSPALVIGNPTRDLRYAGEEAEAIHRVLYPRGTYLDADTAVATQVSARLADLRGGVLHLACHARVDPGERHSAYLDLAAGSRLAAEELTDGTIGRYELGLVCLAACWSNVSSRGYDEAYSLATAFLAAGAHTVLGSLWPVPDEATSLLMYMTHHYLRRESLPPRQALRRAQLWMLDPRRSIPPEMPAHLAVRARYIHPDHLVGWAGFTHQGW
ncbi:CHAT domain-containing protein [Streptomyces odontomachi]|uniref:CHAT domain-containing protein n=1 Tax=Streptomyces odontomachi TaxID=2944940 RepID=UPI0021088B7F|nr:CHAT domain-containing protein [Streptomyces sp. ODS25]